MRRSYTPRNKTPLLPPIDIQDAKQGWFVHNGDVYSVRTAPSAAFRDAVLALAPHWLYLNDERGALLATDMDFLARWWLLCELTHGERPMRLYGHRDDAEQACGVLTMRV